VYVQFVGKSGGYGGSVNLGAHSETLKIQGKENISIYKAVMDRDTKKESIAHSERNFCSKCSSMLWLYDERWPELVHPFASAIDSDLGEPEEMVVVKTNSKPDYVRLPEGKKKLYKNYGTLSIEGWHKKHGLWVG